MNKAIVISVISWLAAVSAVLFFRFVSDSTLVAALTCFLLGAAVIATIVSLFLSHKEREEFLQPIRSAYAMYFADAFIAVTSERSDQSLKRVVKSILLLVASDDDSGLLEGLTPWDGESAYFEIAPKAFLRAWEEHVADESDALMSRERAAEEIVKKHTKQVGFGGSKVSEILTAIRLTQTGADRSQASRRTILSHLSPSPLSAPTNVGSVRGLSEGDALRRALEIEKEVRSTKTLEEVPDDERPTS